MLFLLLKEKVRWKYSETEQCNFKLRIAVYYVTKLSQLLQQSDVLITCKQIYKSEVDSNLFKSMFVGWIEVHKNYLQVVVLNENGK
jgi:hypothetical protein